MKSVLYKLYDLTHKDLKTNINKIILEIPKEKYENIIKGTYNKEHSNIRKILKNYL